MIKALLQRATRLPDAVQHTHEQLVGVLLLIALEDGVDVPQRCEKSLSLVGLRAVPQLSRVQPAVHLVHLLSGDLDLALGRGGVSAVQPLQ